MVMGLTFSCHPTWVTTEWWPLPWTVGEQLPGVSSCRIGSEWQCGNTGNTGNPWQGQTKSWEAARALGPASTGHGQPRQALASVLSLHTQWPQHSASVQARAASSMWPGVPWGCCHSRHYPAHDSSCYLTLLIIPMASLMIFLNMLSVFLKLSYVALAGLLPFLEAESLSGCITETSYLETKF